MLNQTKMKIALFQVVEVAEQMLWALTSYSPALMNAFWSLFNLSRTVRCCEHSRLRTSHSFARMSALCSRPPSCLYSLSQTRRERPWTANVIFAALMDAIGSLLSLSLVVWCQECPRPRRSHSSARMGALCCLLGLRFSPSVAVSARECCAIVPLARCCFGPPAFGLFRR
jgi:hypothetical protein